MKSYKELLTEMLKPLNGDLMLKKLQTKFDDVFLQSDRYNDTTNTIVIRCVDDDDAREYFFGDDEHMNKYHIKELNSFLKPFNWYVNQINDKRRSIVVQQRDIKDVTSTTTYDPGNFLNSSEDVLVPSTANIKQYGFVHVTNITPEQMAQTGIRAKNSDTFDKHDEKRIYLFSLAPQFITSRPNLLATLSTYHEDRTGLKELAKVLTDESAPLATEICQFAKIRGVNYVYFVKKLQTPAKLYKDNAWTDTYTLDAMYTKDYSILPEDIVFLGTVKDLRFYSEKEIRDSQLDDDRRSTSVGEIDVSDPINPEDIKLVQDLYENDIHTRRAIHLAVYLLKTQYGVELTPEEVIKRSARIAEYLQHVMSRISLKMHMLQDDDDISDIAKQQYTRKYYMTIADPIIGAVLGDIDYGKIRTQR